MLALSAAECCAQDGKPKQDYAQEHIVSLKARPNDLPALELVGPDVEQCVRFEADGLRFTLPAGKQRSHTGLRTGLVLQGDFEVTVRFEMLQEADPAQAGKSGTKLHLIVVQDADMGGLTRQVTPWMKRAGWGAWLNRWQEKQRYDGRPATARQARLRLVRSGTTLSYLVAEGDAAEFTVVAEYPCSGADVIDVRLTGETGGVEAALDARVTDLQVRADALPNLPGSAPPRTMWKLWLMAALVLLLALALSAVLLRKRQPARPNAATPVPDETS